MKKLTLFLTLSLLTLIGISTVVKAESIEDNTQDSDSVILSEMDDDEDDEDDEDDMENYEDYEDYEDDEDDEDDEDNM